MKTTINRRNFLRLSATAGAGAILVPGTAVASLNQEKSFREEKLPMRMLGKTGIEIPILSMGVMRADNPSVVRASYNSGVFHFDTAHGYQNGKNEEMLGNFFKDKPRSSFCIATKIKLKSSSAEDMEADFEEKFKLSLSRLQMDYVDIFYAHAFDSAEAVKDERTIACLKKIKSEGKTRFIGFSTHANKPEQLHAAVDTGIYDVILLSYNFKLGNLKETDEAIERAAKAGIGIVVMKSMTGGTEDAEGKKIINAQACLKWVWQNKHVTTIIPGYTNYEQLEDCLTAARNPVMTSEEKEYIAQLKDQEMMYCQQCRQCVSQCTAHLPIPDIMRAYMYNYGYKYPTLSKETLMGLAIKNDACTGCNTCKVTCPSGFDVEKKIAAIMPVLNVPDDFLMG